MSNETTITVNALYRVEHSRKGTFTMWVGREDDEFVYGRVVDGEAKAMQRSQYKYSGDPIAVRKAFCTFTRLDGPKGGAE